ncbi:MAG: hypothetical protein ACC707_19490 [Thiohalomonadales bacterium]
MGAIKKLLIVVVLIFHTMAVLAAESSSTLSPRQQQMLDRSFAKMKTVIDVLELRVESCSDLSTQTVISPNLLKDVDLPIERWVAVLAYFSFKAQHQCEGEALWASAVLALNRFKSAERYYSGENMRITRYRQANFCCGIWQTELKVELDYLKISNDYRNKMESIAELQKPFDLVKTIDGLRSSLQ